MKKLIVAFLLAISHIANAGRAYINAFVVDGVDGVPVKGVDIIASFEDDIGWRAWIESSKPDIVRGRTDTSGFCRLSGKTNCGKGSCWTEVAPSGYYKPAHGGAFTFSRKSLFGVWQPENLVVTMKLQRVEHPIPLFVKYVTGAHFRGIDVGTNMFSKGNGKLSFDFIVGDWLPPVGNGKIADVEFVRHERKDLGEGKTFTGTRGRIYRDEMEVRFRGEGNGLVEMCVPSSYGLKVRTAPEDGYKSDYLCWKGTRKDLQSIDNYDETRIFCFRIRTRRNDKGEIVEAYYGKIYGDIQFVRSNKPPTPIGSVCMQYFLNPKSLDRNLEWDMKNNLCSNPGEINSMEP